MKILRRFHRIGIIGSAQAGKTVFLLSMINQLKAGKLKLGGNNDKPFQGGLKSQR